MTSLPNQPLLISKMDQEKYDIRMQLVSPDESSNEKRTTEIVKDTEFDAKLRANARNGKATAASWFFLVLIVLMRISHQN